MRKEQIAQDVPVLAAAEDHYALPGPHSRFGCDVVGHDPIPLVPFVPKKSELPG